MYKDLLPIGSIIKLIEGERKLMICGRIKVRVGEEHIYDYVGCCYPEGLMDSRKMLFFDHDSIERIFFIGYQDEDELLFKAEFLEQLGELDIRNGAIVEKEV